MRQVDLELDWSPLLTWWLPCCSAIFPNLSQMALSSKTLAASRATLSGMRQGGEEIGKDNKRTTNATCAQLKDWTVSRAFKKYTHTHTQHYAGAQYNKLHTQCTQDYFQRSHTYICKVVEVSVPTHIKVTTLNAQGKPCPLIFDKVEGNLQRGTV